MLEKHWSSLRNFLNWINVVFSGKKKSSKWILGACHKIMPLLINKKTTSKSLIKASKKQLAYTH